MDADDVTIGLAFIAGIISFISPCVLPLVPAYVGYMGGRLTQQVTAGAGQQGSFRQRFNTLIHGLFFVAGFTLFFVIFGLLTTAAVSSLTSVGVTKSDVQDGIARIGGTVVILFGLHIMGVLNRVFAWLLKQAPRLDRTPYGNVISALVTLALIGAAYWLLVESWFLTLVGVLLFVQIFSSAFKADTAGDFWTRVLTQIQTAFYVDTRRQTQAASQYGYLGSLFMGVVFSAGWTPCIGPIYGAVLTLASTGESVTRAGTLLLAYSLGLGIPFLLTALALNQAQGVFRRLQRHMRTIEAVSGVFLVLIGVLVFSGELERLTNTGGNRSSLSDLSYNMEECIVGWARGEVILGRVRDCISDGPKEDFYISYPKETVSTAASPAISVPSLDTDGQAASGPLSVPDLGQALDNGAASESSPAEASIPVGLQEGQRAPDFSLQTVNGQMLALSDLRGQVVLINFWATWCDPCRAEMPTFETIYETYRSDGFVILAINYDESVETVRDFVEQSGLTFPVLLDPGGTVNEDMYGDRILGHPTSFLIDANGVIVRHFPGVIEGPVLLAVLGNLLG